jgi:2-keto-4-pentenoate hydratase/2-oxohepta-3-ene-1,7-dioic acid hydratase in catechol pathway
MKLCSFQTRDGKSHFGFQATGGYLVSFQEVVPRFRPLAEHHSDLWSAPDLRSWLSFGRRALGAAAELQEALTEKGISDGPGIFKSSEITFLPPVTRPGKIIAIGLNYRDHAEEQKAPLPQAPLIFAKFPTALIGHEGEIKLPAFSQKVDVEAELCIVMLKSGRRFSETAAADAIAGYMVGNDVSARDLQFSDKQWVRGKSCDTFAPCGPLLVTTDEVPDPHDLKIELRLNGDLRQSSNTRALIFNCYALVCYISQAITLEAGDIIFTGTPAGVGVFRNPPVFLKPGDLVEVTIEKLGTLRNPVIASD